MTCRLTPTVFVFTTTVLLSLLLPPAGWSVETVQLDAAAEIRAGIETQPVVDPATACNAPAA